MREKVKEGQLKEWSSLTTGLDRESDVQREKTCICRERKRWVYSFQSENGEFVQRETTLPTLQAMLPGWVVSLQVEQQQKDCLALKD